MDPETSSGRRKWVNRYMHCRTGSFGDEWPKRFRLIGGATLRCEVIHTSSS
ncbi:hypothetical protein J8L98_23910 [Pseudoalteromonas sp. MMG013]|uniref:hypothetical protein n=1 Tax=Pseudoalteromonas sp. MMG013 TaxID=2822687 RepID=UPI001B377381|nr:hypothetical protein [Pseudoalteromonas sp. MMG013]MBQ4864734.1 hypothetical protein [Pseudoalteromonas sp. MMG013]